MSDLLVVVFYAATYGALSYLSWREWRLSEIRRRRETRLPLIPTEPSRINTIRRDPSPTPRKNHAR